MSQHKSKIGNGQHLVNLLIGVVGVLLVAKPQWMPVPEIGKAVGEAFLIAILVIYLVEMHSHKRLEDTAEEIIRKIGKNIIPLIYGHELPTALVEALEQNTLQQPVYREKMQLRVELTATSLEKAIPLSIAPAALAADSSRGGGPLAGEPPAQSAGSAPPAAGVSEERLCRLASTYSYTLVNCSDEPVKFPLKVFLERDKWLAEIIAEGRSDPTLEYVKIGDALYVNEDDKAGVLERLNLPSETPIKSINDKTEPSSDGNGLFFEEKEFSIPAKGSVDISFHGVLHKRYSDNEVWSTYYPTLEVDLTISSVDFQMEARFPESGDMLKTNIGAMTSQWTYTAPLLAGQAVLFWWRPKRA